MALEKCILSKTRYMKGVRCLKALWFSKHREDLKHPLDSAAQARIEEGNEVGELAKTYFSSGIEVDFYNTNIASAAATTQELILQGHPVIYEATAIHPKDGSFCKIDILKWNPEKGAWDLIEVKASTSPKDRFIDDVAFQYHVFSSAGYKIAACYLMLINNKYVREKEINPSKIFRLEDISEQILEKQGPLEQDIQNFTDVLISSDEPKIPIGERCHKPYECEYTRHCWRGIPKYSIFKVFSAKKSEALYEKIGSYEPLDIPEDQLPSGNKLVDLLSYKNHEPHFEREPILDWFEKIKYPLFFLDYETVNPAIPLFEGTRPFQKIPFQFSVHILGALEDEPKHIEFLHQGRSDPRPDLIKQLCESIGASGSVIVYNQTFEKGVNQELAERFPEVSSQLNEVNHRMVDLMTPFQKRWIYHPGQCGSHSIKSVLPAFTDLSYEGMEISKGDEASNLYLGFLQGKYRPTENFWQVLSKYCTLDTYSMILLLRELEKRTSA